ncbi:hypothetical protein DPMN_094444 [Dreissena polymorpha]|uniref:Secreted protein n=1 Tax=Dreissena polymorpha TaxID=45954 RepID=A0A9D4R2V7_DREPO|nr:hypothetical protein DPMN_094444 [Dreissena polymorpha]
MKVWTVLQGFALSICCANICWNVQGMTMKGDECMVDGERLVTQPPQMLCHAPFVPTEISKAGTELVHTWMERSLTDSYVSSC